MHISTYLMEMENKRGMFFSTDAIIALTIIFLSLLIIYPTVQRDYKYNFIQEDFIVVLSSLKTGEIADPYFQDLISDGKITQLNKSILEQMGEFYVTNITLAKEMANNSISFLDTEENIGIWYGNSMLASKNSTPFENAENIEVERQIISGLKEGESVTGYSARAFLTNPYPIKYFYFGGYIGDGNITKDIDYTGQLDSVNIEIAINKDFDVYINDNFSGHYQNSSDVFTPSMYDLSAYINNFHSGKNEIEFRGNNLYISGGFIKIIYNNSTLEEIQDTKYFFDGIEGLINVYDSIYIPGNLNSLEVYLHYNSEYETFLTIGNKTVYESDQSGETTVFIDNSNLSSQIDYNSISNKTIPLRLGLKEIQEQANNGNVDVILITDLSGSMDSRMDNDNNGIERDCDDPNLLSDSTKRISIAKCLDKDFVEKILSIQGNRVALSAFYADGSYPFKGRVYEDSFTNNTDYLKSKIDQYVPKGGTCICCSINDAYKLLYEESNDNRSKFVVVMSDGIPTHTCQASSGCAGTRTGLPSNEGLWLGFGAGCYGGADDCESNDCSCASQNANWSACRVHNQFASKIYSIGFGPAISSSCTIADNTMKNIANCGNGSYFSSSDPSALQDIYDEIAEEILSLNFAEQISEILGNFNNTILYPDSYVSFNYSSEELPYGLITTAEKTFTDEYNGNFDLPDNSSVIKASIVSYSGPRWTNYISVNNISIYNLSKYGSDYIKLGDPYNIYTPNSIINNTNYIYLTTGNSPSDSMAGSDSNKIIYTIVRDMSSFSPVVSFADGCIWTVQFEDNTNISTSIPLNYSGTDNCYYQDNLESYNSNDALQAAVYNLLKLLDFDSNGKVDVKFNEQNLDVGSTQVTGIPYEWSTEVQVRKWR